MNVLEQLAEMEHNQWISWASSVIKEHGRDLPISVREKWLKNMLPYEFLSEEEKEKDRIWARKIIIFFDNNFELFSKQL
jgi:hypothetical protein